MSQLDLTKPLPVLTTAQLLANASDPAKIALIEDPLLQAAFMSNALANAEGGAVQVQGVLISGITAKITQVNSLMSDVNNASARLKSNTDDNATTYIQTGLTQAQADQLKNDLITAGVDPKTISVSTVTLSSGLQAYQVTMSKANLQSAGQNMQLKVDDYSSQVQQMNLFLQTLTGKYNAVLTQASELVKARGNNTDNTIQNLR